MKHYENFYKHGFEIIDFNPHGVDEILKDISSGIIKENFSLQQKYPKTGDLRPNVLDYSEKFLEVLKVNKIKSLIRSRILKDLILFHVQIRVADSTISYMDWHRDTYYDNGKRIGMMPSACKIIYYPEFKEKQEPRLYIADGSHRIMIDQRSEDLKLVSRFPTVLVKTANDQAVFFDTSLLHAVVPDEPNSSSIRLIYSFAAKEQLLDHYNQELHLRTAKEYENIE